MANEELEIKKGNEEEPYITYFNEYAVEDVDDILTICESASVIIYNRFRMKFDDPRLLAVTWAKIYEAFFIKLKSLQTEYTDFTINICERLQMSYSNSDEEDNEKAGNFCPSIVHLNNTKKNDEVDDPTATSNERAVQWNNDNIIKQPKLIREISVNALKILADTDIQIGTAEIIVPIFITVYETLINYIKIKRREMDQFEYKVNFVSLMEISARETEDADTDDIYIKPSIDSKTGIKNDEKFASKE